MRLFGQNLMRVTLFYHFGFYCICINKFFENLPVGPCFINPLLLHPAPLTPVSIYTTFERNSFSFHDLGARILQGTILFGGIQES